MATVEEWEHRLTIFEKQTEKAFEVQLNISHTLDG